MAWATAKGDLKWGVAVLLFAVLAISGGLYQGWSCPVGEADRSGEPSCATLPKPGTEDLTTLTNLLLAPTGLVLVIEILGIALVAALIGALVLALREKEVA